MTGVEFHFNAPDKQHYACRLLRKAAAKGNRVVVTADENALAALDTALWTFSQTDFIAHCRAGAPDAMLRASLIVLARAVREVPHTEILVNLGSQVPEGFERFGRLIEVVSLDEEDRLQARQRYKHYKSRGYAVKDENLVLKESA